MADFENDYLKEAIDIFNKDKEKYIEILTDFRSIIAGNAVGKYNSSLMQGELDIIDTPLYHDFIGKFQSHYLPVNLLQDEKFSELKKDLQQALKKVIDDFFISGANAVENNKIIAKYNPLYMDYAMAHVDFCVNNIFSIRGSLIKYLDGLKSIVKKVSKYFKSQNVDKIHAGTIDAVFLDISDDDLCYSDFDLFFSQIDPTRIKSIKSSYVTAVSEFVDKGVESATVNLKGLYQIDMKQAESVIKNNNNYD